MFTSFTLTMIIYNNAINFICIYLNYYTFQINKFFGLLEFISVILTLDFEAVASIDRTKITQFRNFYNWNRLKWQNHFILDSVFFSAQKKDKKKSLEERAEKYGGFYKDVENWLIP